MIRLLMFVCSFGLMLGCEDGRTVTTDTRAPLLSSVVHQLASDSVGDDFRITVVLPRSYADSSAKRFPVVYLLDGNMWMGMGATLAWGLGWEGAPDMILVGIDYPVETLDGSQGLRYRDLTPTADTAEIGILKVVFPEEYGLPAPSYSGGGPAFLRFIEGELIPFVDRTYRTDISSRTLGGFSLGGLFTAYAMMERPDLFQRYLVLSPSFWWDHGSTLKRLTQFAARPSVPPMRLFVSIGLLEETPADSIRHMVRNVQAFEQMLRTDTPTGLEWHVQYFPDETHSSGGFAAVSRGLRFALGLWPTAATKK